MKVLGLIGYPLSHSFSQRYFSDKFRKEGIRDVVYENFEIKRIDDLPALLESYPNLCGLNVTIPYKEEVKHYVHELDPSALKVGAVNVIKILPDQRRIGYNSDYYGFRTSLESWLAGKVTNIKSLVEFPYICYQCWLNSSVLWETLWHSDVDLSNPGNRPCQSRTY